MSNKPKLQERFLVPPFSLLDGRQGYWQNRKAEWLKLGIKSELGRSGGIYSSLLMKAPSLYDIKAQVEKKLGRIVSQKEIIPIALKSSKSGHVSGNSIFDPVLTELAYSWFCPKKGVIVDPFAGGSVRGVVASVLGRRYIGVDLNEIQTEENRLQAKKICTNPFPLWITGDSADICNLLKTTKPDFIFSCPPYFDLERYSQKSADLSNMEFERFLASYYEIIERTASLLKDDRFACFVIGDVRDKRTGNYRNLVSHTILAFEAAGLSLYNEAILATQAGSLPIRVSKPFIKSRKLGKSHQNVLIFVKGDAVRASEACGSVIIEPLPFENIRRKLRKDLAA